MLGRRAGAGEATALQAKAQINFKDVPMCGTSGKKQKSAGWSGTGSITMTKTNSRMALKIADEIKAGRTPEFTIIGKLADPDGAGGGKSGAEGCNLYGAYAGGLGGRNNRNGNTAFYVLRL